MQYTDFKSATCNRENELLSKLRTASESSTMPRNQLGRDLI
jgi:hypothetical protein